MARCTSSACWHAVVETGRTAGPTVVRKPRVDTFVFGLVQAQEIDVAAECPGGVARVEAQQTFLNGLVGAITYGIHTPFQIRVACAGGRSASLGLPPEPLGAGAAPAPAATRPPADADPSRPADALTGP